MIDVIKTFAAFVVVLGTLVFVHELGHFVVAKALGIGVRVFSLGLGPRLFGFRRGETDYRVAAIPLGGYVRMAGDEADEHRTGAPDEFLSRPRFQRFLVFVAGAAFNIALALVLTWIVLVSFGQPVLDTYPVVGQVLEGSGADRAGFVRGDRILAIEGRDARDVAIEIEEILMAPDSTRTVTFERDGARMEASLETGADPRYRMGFPGWDLVRESSEPPEIGYVVAGEVAEAAGIRVGDRIVSADGRTPIDEVSLRGLLAASPGRDVELGIERDGVRSTIVLRPADLDGAGRIGVSFANNIPRRKLDAWAAVPEAFRVNVDRSSLLFLTLRKLFQREISVRAFSGPIEIAQFSRQAAVSGWETFLTFLAFISLQLGILNLLPIPVLDGGHITILAVESVMRRDLSDQVKERVMQVGLVFLLAFFGIIIYFDVIKNWFS